MPERPVRETLSHWNKVGRLNPYVAVSHKGRRWTQCKCGIWVQGSLGGQWKKDSLNPRDWAVAAAIAHGIESPPVNPQRIPKELVDRSG
jgi:hypothetical protein